MILTSIEKMQMAWFHYNEGYTFSEVAYIYGVHPIAAFKSIIQYKELYDEQ